jgi:hypothetical protein
MGRYTIKFDSLENRGSSKGYRGDIRLPEPPHSSSIEKEFLMPLPVLCQGKNPAALYPHSAGLIIESGLADPLERILVRVEPYQVGATPDSLRAAVDTHLNQKQKIQSFKGRTLIMHTLNDDLVEVSHAERLYEWANEPKEKLIFDRGDHNTILASNSDAYFKAVELFVGRKDVRVTQ